MAKSLGIKESEYYGEIGIGAEPTPKAQQKERVMYPELALRGKQVDHAGLGEAEHNDEITITCKVRVKEISDSQSDRDKSKRVELEVQEITPSQSANKSAGDGYQTKKLGNDVANVREKGKPVTAQGII